MVELRLAGLRQLPMVWTIERTDSLFIYRRWIVGSKSLSLCCMGVKYSHSNFIHDLFLWIFEAFGIEVHSTVWVEDLQASFGKEGCKEAIGVVIDELMNVLSLFFRGAFVHKAIWQQQTVVWYV